MHYQEDHVRSLVRRASRLTLLRPPGQLATVPKTRAAWTWSRIFGNPGMMASESPSGASLGRSAKAWDLLLANRSSNSGGTPSPVAPRALSLRAKEKLGLAAAVSMASRNCRPSLDGWADWLPKTSQRSEHRRQLFT